MIQCGAISSHVSAKHQLLHCAKLDVPIGSGHLPLQLPSKAHSKC
jgi:hypothetical protein